MNESIPDKSYFRIGEVSKILGVEPYVVRYWESEFKTVKPVRTRSDQRLYRKQDVEQLLTIKNLLYRDMYTIAGAKKRLEVPRGKEHDDVPEAQREMLVTIKKELMALKKIVGEGGGNASTKTGYTSV